MMAQTKRSYHQGEEIPVSEIVQQGEEYSTDDVHAQAEVNGVPVRVQRQIDEFIELRSEFNTLKGKIEGKHGIKPLVIDDVTTYGKEFKQNNKTKYSLFATNGSTLTVSPVNKVVSTSKYTAYNLVDVQPYLDEETYEKVTEVVVNADKLEALVTAGDIPEKALEQRVTTESQQLNVSKG